MARTSIQYELTIGLPVKVDENFFIPYQTREKAYIALDDFYKDTTNAYRFTKNHLTFSIHKSRKENNSANLTIFNLDEATIKYLESNAGNNLAVILKAGDNDSGLTTIFNGTMQYAITEATNEDTKTKLILSDGSIHTQNALSLRTYPRGTRFSKILLDLQKDLGAPVAQKYQGDFVTNRPLSLTGSTENMIKRAVDQIGANFSIQDGYSYVMENDKRLKTEVSKITENTGLIGHVQPLIKDSQNGVSPNVKGSEGIKFTCLLDGNIAPEQTVYVKQGRYDGAYKVDVVDISGSYFGNDWICVVEAFPTTGVLA